MSLSFHRLALILYLLLTVITQTNCLSIQHYGNDYYTIIPDEARYPEHQPHITSFYVDEGIVRVLTLDMTSANLMRIDSYLYPSMQVVNRTEYSHECEQTFIVSRDKLICLNNTSIIELDINYKQQLHIINLTKGKYNNIVAISSNYQSGRNNIEIYQENDKTQIKCTTFNLKACKSNFQQIIKNERQEEPVFIKINNELSLLITKLYKNKKSQKQEILNRGNLKRSLNNMALFGTYTNGTNIATLNIPLGTSQTITYPAVVDDRTSKVYISQNISSIPYHSEIIENSQYSFSPPWDAFDSLGTYLMRVRLYQDYDHEHITIYYYTIVYTNPNSAPRFSIDPTFNKITTRFSQQKTSLALPSFIDDEGHTVTLVGIPSSAPYITFDSGTNKFIVDPQNAAACGSINFSYHLTDTNMNSTSYSMTVDVTNVAPDFQTTPNLNLNPSPSNYQLHVMDTFSITLPPLYDEDGGKVYLNPGSYPGAGSTALVLTHDTINNKLIIKSTQIQNCGTMNTATYYGMSTHVIIMHIEDLCSAYKDYQISVDVYNTAPQFTPTGFTIPNVEISLNSVKLIDLSNNIFDFDNDTINLAFTKIVNNAPVSVSGMFSTIAPATIKINPTTFSEVGQYKMRVEIFDYQPYSSFAYFDVKVINAAPVFLYKETMINKMLHFNNTYEYILPTYEDPEGNQVKLFLQSQPNIINKFAKFYPDINPDRIIIKPNQWNQIGSYQVITTLSDTNNETMYVWKLEIFNTPPYFNGYKKPADQKLRFNSTIRYTLPLFSDDEFNPIIVINKMPKFMTFDQDLSSYTISPTNAATEIGTFKVQGMLSDTKMETEFKFEVTVFNDPPFFKQPLVSNINLGVGFNYTYILPEVEDKEGMTIKMTSQIRSVSGPLPPFIKFSSTQKKFDFSPNKITQIGIYEIEVILDDFYSQKNVYRFRLNVLDSTKDKQISMNNTIRDGNGTKSDVELVQASFKILSVTRDGKCTIKIFPSKGADQLTKFITYDTFKIVIITKRNEPVPYTIDSKDSKQNTVTLSLNFKDPQQISNTTELDRVEVRVVSEPQFKSKELLCFIPFNTKQQASMPPQVNSVAASIASKFKGGVNVIPSSVPGGMAGNLSLSFIIQYIWGLLNDMSFLTINAMISITVPGTAKLIQQALLNFIYLDILQTDKWLIPILFKEEEDTNEVNFHDEDFIESIEQDDSPLNDYFDENGFSNKYIIKNLGSTFVYFVFLSVSLILVVLLSPLESLWSLIKRFSLWLKGHMIWNFTLGFLVQQAPPISIACGINLYLLKFNTFDGTSISSVLSLVFIFCISLGKLVVFLILRKYHCKNLLKSDYFESRYGILVDGLNLSNSIGVYWNLLILIRWTLTNTVLIIFRDHNYGQILCLLIFSYIFQGLMVFGKPFDDTLENHINFFNEVMVSAYLYVLMMLTDYLGENQYRVEQGTVLVVIIMTNVGVNILKLLYNVFKSVKNYCYKKNLERLRAWQLDQERAHIDELIRQQEEIAKLLSNPQLLDPNYIPTIEEEQALANRKLLFQGDLASMSLELRAMIEKINKLRFGLNGVETGNGFGRIINNWKGNNQKLEMQSETGLQTSRSHLSMKTSELGQGNNFSIFNPKNGVTRENIKRLMRKQKQSSKKRRKQKSPIMNNINQKNEWNFEDDYNANQYIDQQFKSSEAISTLYPLQNTSLKLYQMESTQEQHIQAKAMSLIEEELKERKEKHLNQTNHSLKPFQRELWR